jgi:hypothetical protein
MLVSTAIMLATANTIAKLASRFGIMEEEE